MRFTSFTLVVVLWIHTAAICLSQVEISPLFTDHALLQQDRPLQVWGSGPTDEIVTVSFQKESKSTKVNSKGQWTIKFKEPDAGGPYILRVNDRVYRDIYVGDVWLAGGQSNMEWKMSSTDGFEEEKQASIPRIHYFKTPHALHNKPQWDIADGEWIVVDSSNLSDVSGVAYFFAKDIVKETGTPLGIVDHSWGGTTIEGWMSPKKFLEFPDIEEEAEYFTSLNIDFELEKNKLKEWVENMDAADEGLKKSWSSKTDFSDWSTIEVPGKWESKGYTNLDGIAYFAKNFDRPKSGAETCELFLGKIDDSDETYINGVKVGGMDHAYSKERVYKVPASLLKDKNTIVVKVRDYGWAGGFRSAAENIYLQCGQQRVDLAGDWKMKIGTPDYPIRPQDFGANSFPSIRYQAMMVPLFKLSLKGMIWYQGEMNAYINPNQYGDLFRSMIEDYRNQWKQEFPFLFVQLANYKKISGPEQSDWAIVRDGQASVLDLPLTAMATAIDLGEADDIHPRNKKDVGHRLASGALSLAYKKPRPYLNPTLASMSTVDTTVLLSFENFGLKLRSKTAELQGFYVDGPDGSFRQVFGVLENNQVILNVPEDAETLYYGWSDNPGKLSLFGSYGLPVLPFRMNIQ